MNAWLFVLLFSVFNPAFASLPDLKSQILNKNYSKAINTGEALKAQNPNSVSILFYTALAYQKNKQFKIAKSYYLDAIKLNTTLPEVYNNLASIYVTEKNYIKAAETLTDAINSQPNMATAYANLSQIYRYLASQAYQKVLDKDLRQKRSKTQVNTQLLASLDINEVINPIPTETIQPPIVVAAVIKKPLPIVKPIVAKATITNPTITNPAITNPTINKPILPSAEQTIIKWAKAWQAKQYNNYINSYSKTYAPKNLTHNQWLTQREKRIKRPGNIAVSVGNFDVKLTPVKAYINFDQAYSSATYQDKVRKRMHLTLINGEWLITSEVTLSVL